MVSSSRSGLINRGRLPRFQGLWQAPHNLLQDRSLHAGIKLPGMGHGPDLMKDVFAVRVGSAELGANCTATRAYAGIWTKGKILPSGMEPGDFDRSGIRTRGFDIKRKISLRVTNEGKCLVTSDRDAANAKIWENARGLGGDDLDDDPDDRDEDLLPDSDFTEGADQDHLFIHGIDAPFLGSPILANEPNGASREKRANYVEFAQYEGERCSNELFWSSKIVIEKQGGAFTCDPAKQQIRRSASRKEDGHLASLLPDGAPAKNGNIQINSIAPNSGALGLTINVAITGGNLRGQDGCKPLAYLSFDKEKTVTFRGTIQTVINIGDAFIVNVNEGASDNSRIIGPVRLLFNRTEIPGAIILPEFPFVLDVRVVIQDKTAVLPKSFTFSRQ
jgi:hypothetical protein